MEIIGSARFTPKFLFPFWQEHPALLYALAAVLGTAVIFMEEPWILAIPIAALAASLLIAPEGQQQTAFLRLGLAAIVGLAACLYCHVRYHAPMLPPEGLEGQAYLSISHVSEGHSSFGASWHIKGTVKAFTPITHSGSIARGIPYTATIPAKEGYQRPVATNAYLVTGKLRLTPHGSYTLSVKKGAEWHRVAGTWSLAEARYWAKNAVKEYLNNNLTDSRSAILIIGLITGELNDRQTRLSLGRFGLQHLLAISGFHFAILASTIAIALGLFLPYRTSASVLLVILTAYCLFLGFGPSVMRAYLTAAIVLIGQLLQRPARPLNSMGVAMGVIILYDPASCLSPAFQLSFLATSAILLLYQPIDTLLKQLWPQRSLSEAIEMRRLDQHAYILLSLCRQALALTLAVHVLTVPLCLYTFEQFPLFSLLFNIFFPFLISLTIILLLLATTFHVLVPPLGEMLHHVNSYFTQALLNLTFNVPTSWDFVIRLQAPPVWTLYLVCITIIVAGIGLRHHLQEQRLLRNDLAFL